MNFEHGDAVVVDMGISGKVRIRVGVSIPNMPG
jgi:hypothetical protein